MVVVTAAIWANNTSRFTTAEGSPMVLAHRGLGQTFDLRGVGNDTCTAERIHPPEHPYLENTLPSMQAAFQAGADIVELDVQLTADGRLAVFHDSTLECRTDGRGRVADHTLAELQTLDVGFGYTTDGGRTFPFRGKGTGLLPSLEQVLEAFPDRQLLLNPKNDDPAEGRAVGDRLRRLPGNRLRSIAVYGGDRAIAEVQRRAPAVRVMSRAIMKRCLGWYVALGWSGHVPSGCEGVQLHVPEGVGRWLWGWPHRFVDRMDKRNTRVVVVAGAGGFSEGFDTADDIARLPRGFSGVIWTNRVDRVAPLLQPGD
ncbi:MAG TPA: glycerophosphodiester phosphodiesterase family protein [Actinomycetota bacterium]|nr:glycerophosphodiester phosphodiesterase family protein [Actinomycetota bacterium]